MSLEAVEAVIPEVILEPSSTVFTLNPYDVMMKDKCLIQIEIFQPIFVAIIVFKIKLVLHIILHNMIHTCVFGFAHVCPSIHR